MNLICLSCPGVTLALQNGGFVPGEWLAAKCLYLIIVWGAKTNKNKKVILNYSFLLEQKEQRRLSSYNVT